MTIEIPSDVLELGKVLECAGYEWVLVGGCVRDMLLGVRPHDWDICTGALPEQVLALPGIGEYTAGAVG